MLTSLTEREETRDVAWNIHKLLKFYLRLSAWFKSHFRFRDSPFFYFHKLSSQFFFSLFNSSPSFLSLGFLPPKIFSHFLSRFPALSRRFFPFRSARSRASTSDPGGCSSRDGVRWRPQERKAWRCLEWQWRL